MKRHVSILSASLFLFFCLACHLAACADAQAQDSSNVKPAALPSASENLSKASKPSLDCKACHSAGHTLPYLGGEVFHKEPREAYSHGFHAQALQNGRKAASCLDCHATGGDMTTILPQSDPASTINRASIAKTCGGCHSDKSTMQGTGISNRPFLAYQESAHARAIARGNIGAAVCTDCHNSHDILPASNDLSPISRANIPKTCAKCHSQVVGEFIQSVHGQATERGVSQSPTCVDCHGIHSIKPHRDARATLGGASCARCHEGVRLAQEFGVQGDRVSSYEDSYHGMAKKFGSSVAADCASCHGVHNILPSSDPKSMIHPANLVKTCGQCHIGAGENFILGKAHLDVPSAKDAGSIATRWVRRIYLILIGATIGGMVIHNLLVWRKKAALKRRAERRVILRMTKTQRWQHWLLLSSFFALVVTGFALRNPDSWATNVLGLSEGFRRLAHRAAGVILIAVGAFHIFYMLMAKEGRKGLFDLLPRKRDLTDFAQSIRYYAGLRSTKPKFDRFGYGEKAEYWAVVWGTAIMTLTGLMVWFKVEIFGFLPRWAIDVALSIHFYEAVLATLAIAVWHIYNVVFDPDVYPLNWALIDGHVSEEFYKQEHELDYERMKAEEAKADEARAEEAKAERQERSPGREAGDGRDISPASSPGD